MVPARDGLKEKPPGLELDLEKERSIWNKLIQ